MEPKRIKRYEWICTRCGTKAQSPETMGRPRPGFCPRSANQKAPHRWVKNRTF